MFDIRTQLVRPGRDSIYRWTGQDANFAAALLGSLTGVLTAAMQAAGGEPVAGTKSVTPHVKATFDGAPWIDAPPYLIADGILTLKDNFTEGDPGFVDAAGLNFQLRDDSPVYSQIPGFQRIPFEEIGLQADEYRRAAP